jgi:hypothetical protein
MFSTDFITCNGPRQVLIFSHSTSSQWPKGALRFHAAAHNSLVACKRHARISFAALRLFYTTHIEGQGRGRRSRLPRALFLLTLDASSVHPATWLHDDGLLDFQMHHVNAQADLFRPHRDAAASLKDMTFPQALCMIAYCFLPPSSRISLPCLTHSQLHAV